MCQILAGEAPDDGPAMTGLLSMARTSHYLLNSTLVVLKTMRIYWCLSWNAIVFPRLRKMVSCQNPDKLRLFLDLYEFIYAYRFSFYANMHLHSVVDFMRVAAAKYYYVCTNLELFPEKTDHMVDAMFKFYAAKRQYYA